MHQTTVRFSPELWSMLEQEAARCGVSVAHYVREAALARLAFLAGKRSAAAGQFAWADAPSDAVQAQARLASTRSAQLRSRAEAPRRTRET